MSTTEVIVGVVGRAHGIMGDVSVEPRTDEPDRRFAPGASVREEYGRRRFTVERMRWHSGRLLVRFEEAKDRTAAEGLRGIVLVADVPHDERPADPEEFYDRQLVGLRVLRADGTEAGRVLRVEHPGAQDLLVVDAEAGERLVPFTVALVPTVDLAAGTCTLADVGGLVDDLDDEADQP